MTLPATEKKPPADKPAPVSPEKHFRFMLRARNTLLWVVTNEERRAERAIAGAASKEGYPVRYWDCATGAKGIEGEKITIPEPPTNPHSVFEHIRKRDGGAVWIMRDLPYLLDNDPILTRALKSLARDLQDEFEQKQFSTVVVLSPVAEVPPSLRGAAIVIDWPLPTREEVGRILDDVTAAAKAKLNGEREKVIDSAAGLAADDIAGAFAFSIVQHGRVDPGEVAAAKKTIIDRDRLLTWYDPDPLGLDAIGGLDLLKGYVAERRHAFSAEARAFKLPPPKGILLMGPSGTGKSLTAKCIATVLDCPLLRLDLGAVLGGIVGQSQGNIRRALKTAEAVMKCVLWIDELEKALAGATGYAGDGGVAADQLATLLTWMQETTLPIFVVGTCNDPLKLQPELISRFDEAFFVDLPMPLERAEILSKTLVRFGRQPQRFDLLAVSERTHGFSGRELYKLVTAALFRAFAAKRELKLEDLLEVATVTVPVGTSASTTVDALREWAKGRARAASTPETDLAAARAAGKGFGRVLAIPTAAMEEETAR